jgi:hypothetical protein
MARKLTKVFRIVALGWLVFATSLAARAGEIIPGGVDYMVSVPGFGTTFTFLTITGAQQMGVLKANLVDFMGIPTYSGGADMIIQRRDSTPFLGDDIIGDTATIPAFISAINLKTTKQVTIGNFTGDLYVTLNRQGNAMGSNLLTLRQTAQEGNATTPEGTYTPFFDIFVDVHQGAPDGTIIDTQELQLKFSATQNWNDSDDFPGAPFMANRLILFAQTPGDPGAAGIAADLALPEPASVLLLMSGLAAGCFALKRRIAR